MKTDELLNWYEQNKRDLPWRRTSDPYAILLSEIMLQQTRVDAVREKYLAFLKAVPDFSSLAVLPEDSLLKLWEGLGYYSRAKNLQKTAQIVERDFSGKLPSRYEQLLKLPGIGEYTAAAVSSIAFSQPVPAVDGNVLRVFTRIHAREDDIRKNGFRKYVFAALQNDIPSDRPGVFNQAMMELGALVCIPSGQPRCDSCPLSSFCLAHQEKRETDFPVKGAPAARRIEDKTVFVLEHDGRFIGYKRPENGLLANLYQLPDREGHLTEKEILSFLSVHGLSAAGEFRIYSRKHVFSHVEWHMQVFYAKIRLQASAFYDTSWLLLNPSIHSLPTAYRICLPKEKDPFGSN